MAIWDRRAHRVFRAQLVIKVPLVQLSSSKLRPLTERWVLLEFQEPRVTPVRPAIKVQWDPPCFSWERKARTGPYYPAPKVIRARLGQLVRKGRWGLQCSSKPILERTVLSFQAHKEILARQARLELKDQPDRLFS